MSCFWPHLEVPHGGAVAGEMGGEGAGDGPIWVGVAEGGEAGAVGALV